MIIIKRILSVCSMLVVLLMAGNRSAHSLPLYLYTPNSALTGYPAPYASVDINLVNPTTANVTFTANTVGSYQYLLGGARVADLNVNATTFSVGNFSSTYLTNSGPGNVSEFGNFNLVLKNFDGFPHAVSSLSFTLTDTSGTWGSAVNVLTLNADGYLAAAHIFVWDGTSSDALATGFAGDGSSPVPEPGTMLLLGAGLLGLAIYGRRRMKS